MAERVRFVGGPRDGQELERPPTRYIQVPVMRTLPEDWERSWQEVMVTEPDGWLRFEYRRRPDAPPGTPPLWHEYEAVTYEVVGDEARVVPAPASPS